MGKFCLFFAFSVLLSIKIIKKRRMYMEYEAFKETLMDFLREKTGGEKVFPCIEWRKIMELNWMHW